MRNFGIDFPHPVLNEFSDDYQDSSFSVEVSSNSDNGADLIIELDCKLHCDGLLDLLKEEKAMALIRLICPRTSFRRTYPLKVNGKTQIAINKSRIAEQFSLQGIIVATKDISPFSLPQFNRELFGSTTFCLKKGAVLADEPEIWVRLDTLIEPNVGGIVQVKCGASDSSIKVTFPDDNDVNPETRDYIYITLPKELYKIYHEINHKRFLKTGVERFIQASVILPALVEGISKLRIEEETMDNEEGSDTNYRETIWGASIYASLQKRGINELNGEERSDYELANLLLGDVVNDALSNLKTKATEWSRAQWED